MTLLPEDGVKPKRPEDDSRDKYFVVIGVENDRVLVGSVLINSIINNKMFHRIAEYQYRITPDTYRFLTKDESYIDCYSIKEIPFERILADAEYIGSLLEEDFSEVKSLLHKSPVVIPAILKKYHIK